MLLKAIINIYCMCTVYQALRMMPCGPSPRGLRGGSCPRSRWDSCPEEKHGVAAAWRTQQVSLRCPLLPLRAPVGHLSGREPLLCMHPSFYSQETETLYENKHLTQSHKAGYQQSLDTGMQWRGLWSVWGSFSLLRTAPSTHILHKRPRQFCLIFVFKAVTQIRKFQQN